MTLLQIASRRTFASLRHHRNYRLFFFGQQTSVAGTWMQNIGLAWFVIEHAPHSRGSRASSPTGSTTGAR